ncbi:MAG: hypothetical protein NC816_00080 [Candidatus Omnitrophica bacterium]|nr:hypothetical protein [Candidatus Omnitrophota bacterium]MCM8832311.1 hypothetical protein [Candidatus Omnitrophota bacterium]
MRGIIFGVIFCFLISLSEIGSVLLSNGSPLAHFYSTSLAIIFLFLIIIFLRRLFKFQDLVIIYIMMIVSCSIVSWGLILNLISFISGISYFATPTNEWEKLIHPYLKKQFFINDSKVISYFYEGLPKGMKIEWAVWFKVLSFWFTFIIGFYLICIFIVLILRKQWIERERLSFPLTELPLRMIGERKFLKDKLMWVGFFIPFLVYGLRGLHTIKPVFPAPNIFPSLSIMRGVIKLPFFFHFEMVGVAFFMPKDVLLSVWFFSFLYILLTGFLKLTGITKGPSVIPSDPATTEVSFFAFGALVVYSLSCIYFAKSYLKEVFKNTFTHDNKESESFIYKVSIIGFFFFLFYLIFYLKFMGLRFLSAVYFLLITILIYLGITRIIAQTGLAYFSTPIVGFLPPLYTFGSKYLGPSGITNLCLSYVWQFDIRTTVMASTANGLKIASEFKVNPKKLLLPILISIFISYFFTSYLVIKLCYKYGGLNLLTWPFSSIHNYVAKNIISSIKEPIGFSKTFITWTFGGILTAIFLTFMKNRFLWWQLSPIGLCLGLPLSVYCNWFSVFCAWIAKIIILKYGGVKVYNKAKSFFQGLILGAFITAGIWNIIGYLTKTTIRFFVR